MSIIKKIDDFDWYGGIKRSEVLIRDLPQLSKGEYKINGSELIIFSIAPFIARKFQLFRIAFKFNGEFLPVYEDERVFVSESGAYATTKRGDDIYLGVAK